MQQTLVQTVLAQAALPTPATQDLSFSNNGNRLYAERSDREAAAAGNWSALRNAVNVSFARSSKRYAKEDVPDLVPQRHWRTPAWRGERVHTQVLIWTNSELPEVRVESGGLKGPRGQMIPAEQVSAAFIRYVMTDEFAGGCGHRKPADFDSSLSADPIDIIDRIRVEAKTVQPVWLSVRVPQDVAPGKYTGKLTVHAGKAHTLQYTIDVKEHVLPPAAEWKFDLDLWQHPEAVARIHGVPRWSEEHFRLMRPYYTMLAEAGQKVITASIMEEPWGHQTYDDFPSLVKWTRHRDGSWSYDYSLFDKYVEFVMSCGIKDRINCYTMIPWAMSFRYHDEALGRDTALKAKTEDPLYAAHWSRMLRDFTQHLKQKGWFGITAIAMDERPLEDMQNAIRIIQSVDPQWKVALAGNKYHPELADDIYDYCLSSEFEFGDEILERRLREGKPSTFYTCCAEKYPNGFTFSPPDEHVWLGWYAAARGFTGYLRWAYNSWVAEPLHDSRFRTWPAGDTYQVYPGPRTSIRFEKLVEGIQDYEKIRILRQELASKGKTKELQALENAVAEFDIKRLATEKAEDRVRQAKEVLNAL